MRAAPRAGGRQGAVEAGGKGAWPRQAGRAVCWKEACGGGGASGEKRQEQVAMAGFVASPNKALDAKAAPPTSDRFAIAARGLGQRGR